MSSVLIVEDYENIKNLYADAFSRAGYKVQTAHSGASGLEKIKQDSFDVIVLDMLMLELSGTDFLTEFDVKKHPNTKVVVASNLDSPNVMQRAMELGAAAYLIKSDFTPDQIVEKVKELQK